MCYLYQFSSWHIRLYPLQTQSAIPNLDIFCQKEVNTGSDFTDAVQVVAFSHFEIGFIFYCNYVVNRFQRTGWEKSWECSKHVTFIQFRTDQVTFNLPILLFYSNMPTTLISHTVAYSSGTPFTVTRTIIYARILNVNTADLEVRSWLIFHQFLSKVAGI